MASNINVSSINTELIVQNYLSIWKTRYIKPLEERKAKLQLESASLVQLKNYVLALRTQILKLNDPFTFQAKKVEISDPSVLKASVLSLASSGVYNVSVSQLAKAHKVASDFFDNTGLDIINLEGAGLKTFRITINGVDTDISVTIDSSDTNEVILGKIASAINSSSANAIATVIRPTQTTVCLVLASKNTGLVNQMSLQDITGNLLYNSGVLDSGGNFKNQLQAPQDSLFNIDGINFQRSSNFIDDAILGVSFNLLDVGSTNLTVTTDVNTIVDSIQKFLDSYNQIINYVRTQTAYDETTKKGGSLLNNSFSRSLPADIRSLMYLPVAGLPSGFNSLASIGIEGDKTGIYSIKDLDLLKEKLSLDPVAVEKIFTTPIHGVLHRLDDYIDSIIYPPEGALHNSIQGVSRLITDLNSAISAKERQLADYEKLLRSRWAAIEKLLATNQSLMDFISQRLYVLRKP